MIIFLQSKKMFLFLHLLFVFYSFAGICSKMAAAENYASVNFWFYYTLLLFFLGLYAFGWQQIIKVLPLSTAFANKAITVTWGLVWGKLLFNEIITIGKLIGISFIIIGIVLFSYSDKRVENEK